MFNFNWRRMGGTRRGHHAHPPAQSRGALRPRRRAQRRVLPRRAGLPGRDEHAFLRAPDSTNDHDLGLFEIGDSATASLAGRGSVGLYHLAWEVDTLADLRDLAGRLAGAGALTGASDHSTTKSLYGKDPDGLEFEIAWIVPSDRLDDAALAGRSGIRPLDLDREIERYGADTAGGIGISRVAHAPGVRA
jgi:catechol 2,3-dioxygenase-like lactoylglutathione lyase family enzyme